MILLVDGINYAEGTFNELSTSTDPKVLSLNKTWKKQHHKKIRLGLYNSRTINFHFSYLPHW
jgi:hypothetical protein